MRTAKPWQLPIRPTTRTELAECGVTDEMLTTQLQRGAVVRVRQGVYLAAASWPDDPVGRHLLRARAELVVSPEAVISRQSAALAWALPTPTARPWHVLPPSVSLPAGAGYRVRSNGSVHHVEQLPAAHLDVDDQGFRITGLAPQRSISPPG